jgi:hypothetical protein
VARAAVGLKSAIPARLYNWLFAGGFIRENYGHHLKWGIVLKVAAPMLRQR